MRAIGWGICCGLLVAVVTGGCATTSMKAPEPEPARWVGTASRADIESVRPEWVEEVVAAEIDAAAVEALLEVEPAELTVYLGTWCSDSRREVARFWRVLDELPWDPPLEIEYVAVDRAKSEPAELLEGVDLRYVPTFVVSRGGREVGRVIEESPGGIESDLLALLTGGETGWISARDDLGEDG